MPHTSRSASTALQNQPKFWASSAPHLLQYIRKTLGYNCVKELIIQNEPSYSFHVEGGAVDLDLYVACYKAMYKRLNDMGMGDIVLVGADDVVVVISRDKEIIRRYFEGDSDLAPKVRFAYQTEQRGLGDAVYFH